MKCEKCKQDLADSLRVQEQKKEIFKLRLLLKQIATAQTIEDRDLVVENNHMIFDKILGGE